MSSDFMKKKYAPAKRVTSFFTGKFIQVTNDGCYAFCQCSDHVSIVELSSGNVIQKIENVEEEVTSISLSPNNLSLAIGFNSSSVKHYEIKDFDSFSPNLIQSFRTYHRGPVLTLCWDASSTLLATGSSDGSARVWDLQQKFCTHSLKQASGVFRVLMFDSNLRDRPWIFGGAEEFIFIWQLESGNSKLIAKLSGHDSAVTAIQLSRDRFQLISCGMDKVIITWNLNDHISKRIIPVFESISGLILKEPWMNFKGLQGVSDEDDIVFIIGNRGLPRIWNVEKSKELWAGVEPLVPEPDREVLLFPQVLYNRSLKSFILTTHDNNILFLKEDSMEVWKQLIGHNDEILDLILLGDDSSHTAVAANSSQIRIYCNLDTSCRLITGHTAVVLGLINHPSDNKLFASCSHDNSARLWRLSDTGFASCIAIATGHVHSVGCVVLARDFLVTGSKDTCIKRWDISDSLKSPSLTNITTLSSTRTQKTHEKDINSLCISKNFKLIATGSLDRTAKLWDATTLGCLGTFQGHKKGVWCVQFSPTDRILASSSADASIKLWNLNDFSNIATFEGHEVSVLKVAWISQGLQLLSSSSDGLVKLWTVKDNTCVNTFDEHDGKLWAMTSVDDGNKIVTGGADSTLIWWTDVTTEEKVKEEEEKQRIVEEEQTLMNLLQEKKWYKALRLSIRLKQPFRTLNIMKELLDHSPSDLDHILRELKMKDLASLIEFVVQWNTKTKNMREAQCVMNFILREFLPEQLEALPGWQKTLEGLLPYTERHMRRVSALHQSATIIHYVKSCVSLDSNLTDMEEDYVKLEEEVDLLNMIPKVKISAKSIQQEKDSGMEYSEDEGGHSEEIDDVRDDLDDDVDDDVIDDVDNDVRPYDRSLPEDLNLNFKEEEILASSSDSEEYEDIGDSDEMG